MLNKVIDNHSVKNWQSMLANAVTSIDELLALLSLEARALSVSVDACRDFPLRVPRGFIARMKKGDPFDPLLLQVLPTCEELEIVPGYTHDPLKERVCNPAPGLLHKYEGRVLLIPAGGCAVNCRYCFRRHFPYEEQRLGDREWAAVYDYVANHSSINEVILSGGDPLLVKDQRLTRLIDDLAGFSHVKRVRIHTRLPVVIPERVTKELVQALSKTRLQSIVVLRINHANEIDEHVGCAVEKLRAAQVTVLNQAVLLKGVNDDAEQLVMLSERLFEVGILPYYLHMLDKVAGAAHFAVDEKRAVDLMEALRIKLPGFLVPKLVREVPGAAYKVPI